MKRTLSYPELWKQKRKELPVKGKPDAGWQQLRSVLDSRMPAPAAPKKPSRFKMPKWGLHVLFGFSTVAAVYMVGRIYLSKNHPGAAKPNTLQVHRDSMAPAATDTSPAPAIVKPAAGDSASGIIPIIAGAGPRLKHQTKPNTGTGLKRGELTIDSIKAPAILNLPVRRDSMVAPMEALPLKPVRDSAAAVDPEKKDIKKDTSAAAKKLLKKKRRSKFSVSF